MDEQRFVELFTARQAGRLRLPRLPSARSTQHPARPARRRALPRARLQRGGHDHDAVRHGRAERDEPLPPVPSRPSGDAAARSRTRDTLIRRMRARSWRATTTTSASTSRTCPRSATGPGPREPGDEIAGLVAVSPLAREARRSLAILVERAAAGDRLLHRAPDPAVPAQRVAFGTSGHRGSSFDRAFNEAHILAITQAICRLPRRRRASTGRSSSASTPTRSRSRRSPARSRCWPPTASR